MDDSELPKIHAVNAGNGRSGTGFHFVGRKIKFKEGLSRKNVNNYIMVLMDGRVKTKGGYVTTESPQQGRGT